MKKIIAIYFLLILNFDAQSQVRDKTKAISFFNAAWDAYQQNYFKKCINLLDSALFYDSSRSHWYQLKSEALWFLGKYSQAAEVYKTMISLGDSSLLKVSAIVFLGMLYDMAKMSNDAKAEYARAVALWENGYIPLKQFHEYERSEYILALAFLGSENKAKELLKNERGYYYKRLSSWLEKSPKELLSLAFSEYLLPKDIIPLEE